MFGQNCTPLRSLRSGGPFFSGQGNRMLVLVQFAFADLRPFVAPTPEGPDWRLPPDPHRPDFVRGFGPLRRRAGLSSLPSLTWPTENWFARVDSGIHLPELTTAQFTHGDVKAIPRQALRRLFSDGEALWRLEIGIGFELRSTLTVAQAMQLVHDVVQLPIRVRQPVRAGTTDRARPRRALGAAASLIRQGDALQASLAEASTYRDRPGNAPPLPLRQGRPMVFVEFNSWGETAEIEPMEEAGTGWRRFSVGAEAPESRVDIDCATLRVDRLDLPLIWMRSQHADRSRAVSAVRTTLLRLHAEREVLTQVLRASRRGIVNEATPALEQYLNRADTDLFAAAPTGVDPDRLQEIFAVYDQIGLAEMQALKEVLGERRRQSRERAERLARSYLGPDQRPVYVQQGGTLVIDQSNKSVSISGGNTGTIVTGTAIGSTFASTEHAIGAAPESELKTALASLQALVVQLADRLPDPEDKEQVANHADALAKTALAAKPNRSMLEVTGKGLVDAAKAVAEMAAPIATAVGAVLGILSL